jgi:hypothetical protein
MPAVSSPSPALLGKAAIVEIAADHELETLGNGIDMPVASPNGPIATLVSAQGIRASAASFREGQQSRPLLCRRKNISHPPRPARCSAMVHRCSQGHERGPDAARQCRKMPGKQSAQARFAEAARGGKSRSGRF